MFKKNTAVTGFMVGLVSSTDGSDITTGTPVGYYTLDGGTQTAIGDVTPVHEGNGLWSFDLTAGEMNGDVVALTFTHASAITAHFIIKTDTKIVSELNDVAATAIVSAGAITTLSGAVVNVDTVDTCTTNSDMRGTDSAATAANLATVDTVVDGIQADLSNGVDGLGALKTLIDTVNTDLSNGTDGLGALKALIDTIDTVVDAVKVKTDSLNFTVAGQVDSNIQSINDVTVTGDGNITPFDVV